MVMGGERAQKDARRAPSVLTPLAVATKPLACVIPCAHNFCKHVERKEYHDWKGSPSLDKAVLTGLLCLDNPVLAEG